MDNVPRPGRQRPPGQNDLISVDTPGIAPGSGGEGDEPVTGGDPGSAGWWVRDWPTVARLGVLATVLALVGVGVAHTLPPIDVRLPGGGGVHVPAGS
ncbi:MAG TPA: hypothetical protein VGD67_06830 [Pseudonocardiaceae bacterium]